MKIYKAAIIGLGPSGLAVNKILFGDSFSEIIAFDRQLNSTERILIDNYLKEKWGLWKFIQIIIQKK